MTREEIIYRLSAQKSCLECQVSGKKPCNENCPTQYDAGTIGETIETLGETIKIIENQKSLEDKLKDIKTEVDEIDGIGLGFYDGTAIALEIVNKHLSKPKGETE